MQPCMRLNTGRVNRHHETSYTGLSVLIFFAHKATLMRQGHVVEGREKEGPVIIIIIILPISILSSLFSA